MALPAEGLFTATETQVSEAKQAQDDIRDFIAAVLGTGGTPLTAREAMGLVIGTDVQAYNAKLAALSGLTGAANKLAYFTGTSAMVVVDFTAAGRAVVGAADAAAQRTALGLGTAAVATLGTGTGQIPTADQIPALAGAATGQVATFATATPPAGWLSADGAAISRASYPALLAAIAPAATVTLSIASPCVVTKAAHGRVAGDPVSFETTGVLPTGLTVGTTYYVISAGLTSSTFRVSTSVGGSAVNTSGTQSGTQSYRYVPFGCGNGTTTFNVPDLRGEFVRGFDGGRGVDTGRVFGSEQLDAFQGHTLGYGGAAIHYDTSMASGSVSNVRVTANGTVLEIMTDGVNGTPRVAAETRPSNVALLACIKY